MIREDRQGQTGAGAFFLAPGREPAGAPRALRLVLLLRDALRAHRGRACGGLALEAHFKGLGG